MVGFASWSASHASRWPCWNREAAGFPIGMDRVDHFTGVHPDDTKHLSLKPSEYFNRQCYISYDPDEHTLPIMVDLIGEDRIIWATDYHSLDVTAPNTVEELVDNIESLPEATQRKIMGDNAVKLYQLDR